ncbi:peptidoglycan-binding protein [Streptomyces sp. NPDC057575]
MVGSKVKQIQCLLNFNYDYTLTVDGNFGESTDVAVRAVQSCSGLKPDGQVGPQTFLIKLDKEVPAGLGVHLVLDNYATHKTPAIKTWLLAHPRFHLHFTPTGSSWLNLVERWFAELTNKQIRRGVHRSVQALEKDIRTWIAAWNTGPRPYIWTKTADEILERLASYLNRIPDSED